MCLPSPIPKQYDWQSLLKKDGDGLFDHYRHLLEELGKKTGLLGLIFGRAQNKFQDTAKLRLGKYEESSFYSHVFEIIRINLDCF
jgi:hypothetical protein